MGVTGYRGTAPPKLFVSHDRKEIESLEALVNYTDPFELKDTFVSFEFDMDKGGGTVAELTIINPGASLEKKLFSWYAAIAPQAWKPSQKQDTKDVLYAMSKVDNFYIRWGYVSQPGQPVASTTENEEIFALSHMHKFLLLDMEYEINEKQDKLITLHFLNKWDMSYLSSEANAFNVSPKTFKTSLFHPKTGIIKKPSRVIEELLMQMLLGVEGYVGFSKFSKDQRWAINSEFEKVLGDIYGSREDLTAPVFALESGKSFNMSTLTEAQLNSFQTFQDYKRNQNPLNRVGGGGDILLLPTIRKYYHSFGIDSFVQMGPDVMSMTLAERVASINQTDGRNSTEGNARLSTPEAQALATGADHLVMSEFVVGGFGLGGDPYLIDDNPAWEVLQLPANLISVIPLTEYKLLVRKRYSGNPFWRQTRGYISDLKEILASGRFCMATKPFLSHITEIPDGDGNSPLSLPPSLFYAWPPGFSPVDDTDIPFYDLASAPMLERKIIDYIEKMSAKKNESTQEDGVPGRLSPAELTIIENQEMRAGNPIKSEEVPSDYYAQILCKPHEILLKIQYMLSVLNNRYFKSLEEYINAEKIEFSNVPFEYREIVMNTLKKYIPGIDLGTDPWLNLTGLIVFGTQSFFKELFDWKDKIVSFSIQPDPDKLSTISLAVGHQTRKDNIISDLKWKMDKGSMFLNLRMTPVVTTNLYNVATRFEGNDPNYPNHRDDLFRVLRLAIVANSQVDEITEIRAYGKITIGNSKVGDEFFTEKALKGALELVIKNEYGKDGPITGARLEQIKEDLRFVVNYDFVDIFFPNISKEDSSEVEVEFYITPDGDTWDVFKSIPNPVMVTEDADPEILEKITKKIAYYRYLTSSPLSVLKDKMSVETGKNLNKMSTGELMLLRGKMEVLDVFQKLITDVQITTLGIPEMDIFTNEVMTRNVELWVHDQRVPGTYHWITGMYNILGIMHRIDSSGYETKLRLMRKLPDTGEEMRKSYTVFNESAS
jgi:hypothetical protein